MNRSTARIAAIAVATAFLWVLAGCESAIPPADSPGPTSILATPSPSPTAPADVPRSDAEIQTRMAQFFDDMRARFEAHPMKDATDADALAVVRDIEADASRTFDDLTAARPGACLKPHLAAYLSGLKDLRDAFRMSVDYSTSGTVVPDEDVPNILGAMFVMGQAQVDAEEACGPAST